MKKLALAGVICFIVADSLWLYPPTRPWVLIALGRTSVCSIAACLRAYDNTRARVLPEMRKVGQDGPYDLWSTPLGNFWAPTQPAESVAGVVGEQISDTYGREFVARGDVVLDCGANIGTFTRKALSRGAAVVVCIEPVPGNVECLRRNFADEIAERRVIVYPKGVWDTDAFLPLRRGASSWDTFVGDGKTGDRLPLTTLDSIVRELGLGRVNAIKIDVEGAEKRALVGARSTILRWHPRLSLDSEPISPRELQEVLDGISPGYNMRCGVCIDARTRIAPVSVSFY